MKGKLRETSIETHTHTYTDIHTHTYTHTHTHTHTQYKITKRKIYEINFGGKSKQTELHLTNKETDIRRIGALRTKQTNKKKKKHIFSTTKNLFWEMSNGHERFRK